MALDTQDTGNLIGSDQVEGTTVYGADSYAIGSVERVMIDKTSGEVSYVVLSFGGFLGMGNDYYPLPWHSLKYDTNLGGFVTGITVNQLQGAPKYRDEAGWNWNDPTAGRLSATVMASPSEFGDGTYELGSHHQRPSRRNTRRGVCL